MNLVKNMNHSINLTNITLIGSLCLTLFSCSKENALNETGNQNEAYEEFMANEASNSEANIVEDATFYFPETVDEIDHYMGHFIEDYNSGATSLEPMEFNKSAWLMEMALNSKHRDIMIPEATESINKTIMLPIGDEGKIFEEDIKNAFIEAENYLNSIEYPIHLIDISLIKQHESAYELNLNAIYATVSSAALDLPQPGELEPVTRYGSAMDRNIVASGSCGSLNNSYATNFIMRNINRYVMRTYPQSSLVYNVGANVIITHLNTYWDPTCPCLRYAHHLGLMWAGDTNECLSPQQSTDYMHGIKLIGVDPLTILNHPANPHANQYSAGIINLEGVGSPNSAGNTAYGYTYNYGWVFTATSYHVHHQGYNLSYSW